MDRPTAERMTIHWIWRAFLFGIVVVVTVACFFQPILLAVIGLLLLALLCARVAYRDRDRYIPNLYTRDTRGYDEAYQQFIGRTVSDLRQCKIPGHTLLWEALRLPRPHAASDELLLDLGVWIGWSTRLTSDVSDRTVYGFDTFEGLVEDWAIEDQVLIKSGTFSLAEPMAQRLMRDTGVSLHDGLPSALERKVQFVRGSTYDTLAPFLADRPDAPIQLFHMDLDSYESCLHALETCKNHFVEGSILVFDEYLITNGEMRAFYEFQNRYQLEWRYRAWGLEMWELNFAMVTSRWKRAMYYVGMVPLYCLDGRFIWKFFRPRFWRFWLGAPIGDILFLLGAAGQRKSISVEITGLGTLGQSR